MAADFLQRRRGFRVLTQKRPHGRGIHFPSLRIGRSHHQKIVEILRIIHHENRQVDHRSAPLFAFSQFEKNRQAAHGLRRVRGVRLSARQRKTPQDWHAPSAENLRFGQRLTRTIALEIASDANPLGVIPPKSRMLSVQVLKRVYHRCGSECVRCEPATRIQKQARNPSEQYADGREPRKYGVPGNRAGSGLEPGSIHCRSYLLLDLACADARDHFCPIARN